MEQLRKITPVKLRLLVDNLDANRIIIKDKIIEFSITSNAFSTYMKRGILLFHWPSFRFNISSRDVVLLLVASVFDTL